MKAKSWNELRLTQKYSVEKPIIRGQRLAVERILRMLAADDKPEVILEGYLDTCVWSGALKDLRLAGHDVIWAGEWQEDFPEKRSLRHPLFDRLVNLPFCILLVIYGSFFWLWIISIFTIFILVVSQFSQHGNYILSSFIVQIFIEPVDYFLDLPRFRRGIRKCFLRELHALFSTFKCLNAR